MILIAIKNLRLQSAMVAGPRVNCKHSSGCGTIIVCLGKDVDETRKSQLINGTGCFCTLNLT